METAHSVRILRVLLCFVLLFSTACLLAQTTTDRSPAPLPGDMERAAIARAGFLVGEWAGEGWALVSGQKLRFWVEESFRFRGKKDLMDMEGRFGGISQDGSRLPQDQYALGILFYDQASGRYRMWHYGDGSVFVTPIVIDPAARSGQYTRTNDRGESSRFTLVIGEDGLWVSKREILQPDKTWSQVMEFRMKRAKTE